MYILALETTGPLGSVALINEYGKTLCKISEETMSHLKDLMPMAQAILAEAGISPKDLSAVAASIGPGSFTGIRIGVSSARAIAQALNLPCISVPTLELFNPGCYQGCDPSNPDCDPSNPDCDPSNPDCDPSNAGCSTPNFDADLIVPIFNARRNQVYGAIFDQEGKEILTPGPYMLGDVLNAIDTYASAKSDELAPTKCMGAGKEEAKLPYNILVKFYGDGIDAYEKKIVEHFDGTPDIALGRPSTDTADSHPLGGNVRYDFADSSERYQKADMVAKLALAKYKAGDTCTVNELLPDYMRMTEAEQKLRDGTLSAKRNSVVITGK